jgi:hypothetical protein
MTNRLIGSIGVGLTAADTLEALRNRIRFQSERRKSWRRIVRFFRDTRIEAGRAYFSFREASKMQQIIDLIRKRAKLTRAIDRIGRNGEVTETRP